MKPSRTNQFATSSTAPSSWSAALRVTTMPRAARRSWKNASRCSPGPDGRSSLRPYPWRIHRHAAGTPHQKCLQCDRFRRAQRVGFGPQPVQAVTQPALKRAEVLPFQPIDRVSGRMRLRDDAAGKLLAPVVVVTLRAGQIELTLTTFEQSTA